tara:strand:+ start:2681 stop:2872 length:192 start_codon:yes stop_codon:yes gene_type:complete
MRIQDLVEKAETTYENLSYAKNLTNIAILEKHKIEHGFFCDNYPQLPSDAFTIFLLFTKFYHE